jgi:hypothetical protein
MKDADLDRIVVRQGGSGPERERPSQGGAGRA